MTHPSKLSELNTAPEQPLPEQKELPTPDPVPEWAATDVPRPVVSDRALPLCIAAGADAQCRADRQQTNAAAGQATVVAAGHQSSRGSP